MGYWIFLPIPQQSQPLLSVSALWEVVQHCPALAEIRPLEGQHSVLSAACPFLFNLSWSEHVQEFGDSWGFIVRTCLLFLFKLPGVG